LNNYATTIQDGTELSHFYQLIGGQPYLVRRGLNDIVSRNRSFEEFVSQADHDEGAFGDHLRRILVLLRRDAKLSDVVCGVLRGKPCSDYDTFYWLRSAGIFSGDSQKEACLNVFNFFSIVLLLY
jgi:hypothetical protein